MCLFIRANDIKRCAFIICIFLSVGTFADVVDVSGYFQAYCGYNDIKEPNASDGTSFTIQEVDIIFNKKFTSSLSSQIDLQLTNAYSTEKKWGDFNLDEIWLKYNPSKHFIVKFGYLVPQFNAFNEVKTKFPLIPYILRPLIYESSLNDIIEGAAYIPTHAALQINGVANLGKTKIDYSLFGGNSEYVMSKELKGSSTNFIPSGSDTTNFKLIGGRIGTRLYGLKFGVSSTYDETRNDPINKSVDNFNSLSGLNISKLGHIPRWRLGLDLSYIWNGLTFESEYIYVNQYPDDKEKDNLDAIINATQYRGPGNVPLFPTISNDLSQQFYYFCLTYDFLEKYYISGGFSQFDAKWDLLTMNKGVQSLWGSCGYRINDNITLKLQLTSIRNDLFDDPRVKIKIFTAHLAASVYF